MLPSWWPMPKGLRRCDDDDPGTVGEASGWRYVCEACAWRGAAVAATAHHVAAGHHPIRLVHGPRQVFSCCPER